MTSLKNRRLFLKMLGLGAVAAPVAAKLAVEAEAAPISGIVLRTRFQGDQRYGFVPSLLEAQREINRRHRAALDAMVSGTKIRVRMPADFKVTESR